MIETKLFEIRDRHTLIVAIAQRVDLRLDQRAGWAPPEVIDSVKEAERFLLKRAGCGASGGPYTFLTKITGGEQIKCHYDPFGWGNRTMHNAHLHVHKNWDELHSGDVVDVEFILGETAVKKISERLK